MAPHALVGRMVNVLTWDDLRDVLPDGPTGLITHAVEVGDGDVEVTVRINGLSRRYTFGLDDVEILPCPTDGATHGAGVGSTARLPARPIEGPAREYPAGADALRPRSRALAGVRLSRDGWT